MKLKYKFKVHQLMDSYPTSEDALFDIINYLETMNRIDEEWSDLGIKPAFPRTLDFEDVKLLLGELVESKHLTFRAGNGARNYYKLLTNPF
jgi:hypothetical protein